MEMSRRTTVGSLETMSLTTGLLTTVQSAVAGGQRLFDGLGSASVACAAGGVITATLNSYLSTVLIARGLDQGGRALG